MILYVCGRSGGRAGATISTPTPAPTPQRRSAARPARVAEETEAASARAHLLGVELAGLAGGVENLLELGASRLGERERLVLNLFDRVGRERGAQAADVELAHLGVALWVGELEHLAAHGCGWRGGVPLANEACRRV